MKLLYRERYITMSDLAEKFGVSIRTIKRDIDELSFVIPLYSKAGRYGGGVYIVEGYTWSNDFISQEDIELLKNIKSIAERGGKLILDIYSLSRLNSIINTLSKH